jgi:hypothetical protein
MPVRSFTEDVPMTPAQNLLHSSHRVSRLGFSEHRFAEACGVALTGG